MKNSPIQGLIWLCALAVLYPVNRANAQACAVPCEAIDALESFEIDVDTEGLCAPVMATLFSDAPIPSCGDFTYNWEIFGGDFEWNAGSLASDQSPSISLLDPVTYQIELTIAAAGFDECAVVSSTTYANAAGAPTVNSSDGGEICAYDVWESLVYVNPGNTSLSNFAWIINGDSTFSSFPAPLNLPFEEAGEKEIIAWAQNSCGTSSDTSFVQVRALPQVTVDSDYNWVCQGASVQMNASGAETYTWSSSATLLSGGMVGDSIAVYEMQNSVIGGVEGTNNYETLSCTASGGFQLYSYFVPGISISGDDVICEGTPVEMEAAVQSFGNTTSTQWMFNDTLAEGGAFDLTDLNLVPGDYAVSASVALHPFPTWLQPAGCSGTAQFDFTIAGLPQVSAPEGIAVCNQDFMELLPEGSPVGGTWEGPFVSEGFFNPGNLTPGITELEYHYTDSNGCAAFDAAVVQINEPIWAQAGRDSSVCETNDWLDLSGFEEVESGVWSGPALIDPYAGVLDVGELDVGESAFVYEVGTASCATADTVVWTVLEHPVALLSTQESIACDQDTVWFEVFAAGGTLAAENEYSFGWSDGVQFTASNEPYLIAEANEGFSFVHMEITDDEGCTDVGSAFIEPIELPVITLPEAWQLCDQNAEVDAPMADPSMGVWSGQGVVDPLGTFNPGLVGEGSHSLTYTVTNSSGCVNADSIRVDVTSLDSIAAGPDRSICLGTPTLTLDNFYPNLGGWWSGTGVVDSISPVIQTSDFSEGMHAVVFHAGEGSCAQQDTVWIEIRPLPSATVDYLTTNNCPGDTLALLAQPWGGTASDDYELSWSGTEVFAQGDEFFVNAPVSGPDTLAVSLQVTDASGCSGDVDATYVINALPDVFAGEDLWLCDQSFEEVLPSGLPVTDAFGSGSFFGLGLASGQVDLSGALDPANLGLGSFQVEYFYLDSATGCTNADTLQLTIQPPPTIFAGLDTVFCAGNEWVELESQSHDFETTWSGVGALEQEALIDPFAGAVDLALLGPGMYAFELSGGQNSCLVSDQRTLEVLNLPVIVMAAESAFCLGDADQTLPLAMPTGGIWSGTGILDAEAGEFDTQIGAGDWVVAYEVEDALTGCLNSENHTVHMRSVPESTFPFIDDQCIGQPLIATSISTGVESYAWWLADSLISTSSDVSVLLEDAGVLALSLTVVNEWGCADTAQQDVEWLAPPIAAFTLSENAGCVPLDIGIDNAAEGMVDALQWSLDGTELLLESGDSLVFEQPSGSQGFTLEMEVSNQCGSNTAQAMIEVNAIPVVQLFDTPGTVCSPFSAEFNYTTEGQVETLTWDFGNGEEGSGSTPVWPTFEVTDESELFSVALTAANGCGAYTDSAVVLVESSLVQAEFDLDLAVGCLPLDVQVTDLSVGGDATILDFGDGATAFDSVATHTFTEPGNFAVILAVSNACAVDSFALDVTVYPAFALELSSSNASACVGDSMLFDVETSGLPSTTQIEWISDAGNEAAPAPAIIPWTMPGDQVIFAQGADANGCMGYDTLAVAVHAPLAINAIPSVTSGCSPLEIAMDNQTIGAGEWSWTVGNGPQQSDAFAPNFSLLHSGAEATDLLIEVAVLNEWGCASAQSFSIEVWPAPSAEFQLTDTVICGVPAVIDPLVDAVDGLQLAWFIDSALVAAAGDAVLEIATLGDHAITLLSENEFGCQSFALDSVEVLELPELTLSAGPLMGCAPHLLEIDHSTEGAVEWLLEIYQDSTPVFMSGEMTSEVILELPGTYDLQLSAVSDRGCTSVLPLGDSVVVLPRPVVGFYADPYAGTFDAPDPLNSSWAFENTSDDGEAIWDFGDGELSSEWSTNHTYDAAGTYEVVLMVMNQHGCAEEFTMSVEVLEILEVYVPNAFTPPMQGYSDGINDGWKPVLSNPSLVDRYDLVVYNRYGQKVWETQDPEIHWVGEARVDGAYFAPGGIYTWVLQIDSRAFPESSRQWKGQVNLLR